MSHEPSKSWIDRRVRTAMRGEIDSLHGKADAARSDMDALRTTVADMQAAIAEMQTQTADLRAAVEAIGAEIVDRATQADANLTALREAIDRDERVEALRLRVEGLIAQHRWDTDQLRQAIAALAEQRLASD